MKKTIIFSYICMLIFGIYMIGDCNTINAMELNSSVENERLFGQLYLEKEVYNLNEIMELVIYTNANDREISSVDYDGNGFDLNNDFEIIGSQIHFSVVYDSISIYPKFEILVEASSEIIKVNLYGKMEENKIFINPHSFEEANQVYMNYLKQNDILKYSQIQSINKPITSSNLNMIQISNDNQIEINSIDEPDTFISGELKWKDDNSNEFPLRFSKVQLWDKEPLGERLLMETYTDENGEYSFAFKNATSVIQLENGGYDIFIRIKPEGEDVIVYRGNETEYYVDLGYYEDCPVGNLDDVSHTFAMSDGVFSKALQVSQAAIFASKYYEEMKGTDVVDVEIEYPHNEKYTYCYHVSSERKIYIYDAISTGYDRPNSYAAWDVIMHEYGHHISNMEEITDGPGGGHTIYESMSEHFYNHFNVNNFNCTFNCIIKSRLDDNKPLPFTIDECKYKGMALAWGEAIATYFMLTAQEYYKEYLNNIAFVCDKKYTSYGTLEVNVENQIGTTPDCENSVQAILFDMYDNSTGEANDNVSFGHQRMFDAIVESDSNTFFDFYEYLVSNYNGDRNQLSSLGKLLNYHKLSTTKPVSTEELTQFCPTFTWSWTEHNTSHHFTNRSYLLRFYDASMRFLYQTDTINTQSYTLTESEWEIILNSYTDFYVSVIIFENNYPVTYYESEWTYYDKPEVYTLYNNVPITKTFVGDDCYWFIYTANDFGLHTIQTTGSVDTYGNVFSIIVAGKSTTGSIASNDDAGEGTNFLININLSVGQTIYIRVNTYGWNKTGDFAIIVNSETHTHNYTHSYTESGALNHIAYCECGASKTEAHTFQAFKNGNRCTKCLYFTTGPVITNPIYSNNNVLYIDEKKEDYV